MGSENMAQNFLRMLLPDFDKYVTPEYIKETEDTVSEFCESNKNRKFFSFRERAEAFVNEQDFGSALKNQDMADSFKFLFPDDKTKSTKRRSDNQEIDTSTESDEESEEDLDDLTQIMFGFFKQLVATEGFAKVNPSISKDGFLMNPRLTSNNKVTENTKPKKRKIIE